MSQTRTSDRVLIVGAGPAGLTAALELLERGGPKPLVVEATCHVGGISRTEVHGGNRIDIGGHRFFSKSDRVMDWWKKILPVAGAPARDDVAAGREVPVEAGGPDPEHEDRVMLVRGRLSRIYYLGQFFDYPIKPTPGTLWKLGLWRSFKMGLSYLWSLVPPKRVEASLEDFFVNRFGWELYRTFFRDYTEKVWGVPCSEIDPEWGAQRVKGLSVARALKHALLSLLPRSKDMAQKDTETSLIEQFFYPKLGPGQLWEEVARRIEAAGGEIRMETRAVGLEREGGRIVAVRLQDASGREERLRCSHVLSSMPIVQLVEQLGDCITPDGHRIARGLRYRDFLTVGLLLRKMKVPGGTGAEGEVLPDTWIYVQEPEVKMGRIQIFNNWSPYLVKDEDRAWIGLEYFCAEGDELWSKSDEALRAFATKELVSMGLVEAEDVLDGAVIRAPKTYPCYFGTYGEFPDLQAELDGVENLYCVGRNGQHRYNNADHSMLTALEAVDCIMEDRQDRGPLWSINTEQDYHESKDEAS